MAKKTNYSITIETTDVILYDTRITENEYEIYLNKYMNFIRHFENINLLAVYELEKSVCHKFIVDECIKITLWKF